MQAGPGLSGGLGAGWSARLGAIQLLDNVAIGIEAEVPARGESASVTHQFFAENAFFEMAVLVKFDRLVEKTAFARSPLDHSVVAEKIFFECPAGIERSLDAFGAATAPAHMSLYFCVAWERANRDYAIVILKHPGVGRIDKPSEIDVP